ncbi:hypothetical protein PIB30_037051 [Stylosanthes scabra]|uniref:Uncharacterized protein n=1 Tax=Stylosanthes scabra TaxID=79078 RepID=A0ABU6UE29_9FABA|nr:hypothetical protein [Stylosanthes scabra]
MQKWSQFAETVRLVMRRTKIFLTIILVTLVSPATRPAGIIFDVSKYRCPMIQPATTTHHPRPPTIRRSAAQPSQLRADVPAAPSSEKRSSPSNAATSEYGTCGKLHMIDQRCRKSLTVKPSS